MVVKPHEVAAYLRAHFWVATAASLITVLSVAILAVILASKAAQPTVTDMPEKLLPGHIMPDDLGCSWSLYASAE